MNDSRSPWTSSRGPAIRDASSSVAVPGHGDRGCAEELDTVRRNVPPGQVAADHGVHVEFGVAFLQPADDAPEGEVIDVGEGPLGYPMLEVRAPASDCQRHVNSDPGAATEF